MAQKRISHTVVTAALPYANGSIHLGHMVEYIQADIYVRASRLFGKKVLFCCADDTHGAPIEMKAFSLGVKPEELIAKYAAEHVQDFQDFLIAFDSYYTTHSQENKELSDFIYGKLKKKGLIYKKVMDVIYCTHCKRFLPDRYVKGTCPACKAKEQYGDVCESCGRTHKTTDLLDPHCSLCSKVPEQRQSEHLFFKLSAFSEKLKEFLEKAEIQDEVQHFVETWLADLKDWCISRDGPYFGFPIPDETNKYYYVWLDAPIGYIASTANYCAKHGEDVNTYWKSPSGKVVHIIGKDIMYFHLLFWPAMLMTAGFNLPSKIMVHGFLTVNKEKMSKSRGTFITARQYLDHLPPEYLRFYYAYHLTPSLTDLNFDTKHFKEVVNSELIGNIANFCNRTLSFVDAQFDKELVSFSDLDTAELQERITPKFLLIEKHYGTFNFKEVLREIAEISAMGNKFFQSHEPWNMVKTNRQKAHAVLSFSVVLIRNLSILLSPILPAFCAELQRQLGCSPLSSKDLGFKLHRKAIVNSGIILKKMEDQVEKLVVQDKKKEQKEEQKKEQKIQQQHKEQKREQKKEQNQDQKREQKKEQSKEAKETTGTVKDFPLDLRVGKVVKVEQHPNADKLYVEEVDFGTEKRTIVSGLKEYLSPDEILGKHIVVVFNLKPALLRGVLSQGMLLVGEKEGKLALLEAPHSSPGDRVFVGSAEDSEQHSFKEIEYKDFVNISMQTQDKKVSVKGYPGFLHTKQGEISAAIEDGAKVC